MASFHFSLGETIFTDVKLVFLKINCLDTPSHPQLNEMLS